MSACAAPSAKEQNLDEYKEHKFSDDDRKNLRETGKLGRVVDIVDRNGRNHPSYISIDRKTNEITDIPANKVRIPERIGKDGNHQTGVETCPAPDRPCATKLIERNRRLEVRHRPSANVEQRGVEFVPGTEGRPYRTDGRSQR